MPAMTTTPRPRIADRVERRTELAWQRRLEQDGRRAQLHQTARQRAITERLVARAWELECEAFALTGSTARGQRTPVSDLDYHVVGLRPDVHDLRDDVDIFATDAERFWSKLRSGDDFVQWTLRHGCILFDRTGIFRDAIRVIFTERLWPDASGKVQRLPTHRRHAQRLIALGDSDAAQEEMRAALTSAARAVLLEGGVFPLARRELPDQLHSVGCAELANALEQVIHREVSLGDLASMLGALDAVIEAAGRGGSVARRLGHDRHVVSNSSGGWDIVKPGSSRAVSRHRTQREAIHRARQIVRKGGGGQVVVHAVDGRARERDKVAALRRPSQG
jgi:Uncharacterized protein conserved in bacteria (DUF2188)